jgi:hypothetical protein
VLLVIAVAGLAGALTVGAIVAPQPAQATRAVGTKLSRVQRVLTEARLRRTLAGIHSARDRAWRWQDVMSAPRSRYAASAERSPSLRYRQSVLQLWSGRAREAARTAHTPPRLDAWLCIHRYEGAWNDPNGPYYGGLQMDLTFQQEYGAALLRRKGTADHWTALEQIWVAEHAYESGRGFYPWPNTARWCGLI